jgi:arabinan endo-1,5-alpha-L-arabinosidase
VLGALFLALAMFAVPAQTRPALAGTNQAGHYTNPLSIQIPGDGKVQSCSDPSITNNVEGSVTAWYIYCTTDPLNDNDKNSSGEFDFHLVPMLRSYDLVNWTYIGDAFSSRPAWVASDAGIWAPDIRHFGTTWYLYYTASWTSLPGGGSAIGVATSSSPAGPWTDSGSPVVPPEDASCCPGSRRWVFDPAIVTDAATGTRYVFFGSYFGGISAQRLSADGLHADPTSEVPITIDNKYEGSYVVQHGGFYYLFASATNCCNGPLTGYSVFAGRATNVLGPYIDKEGHSLLEGRTGGTPAISMNGNRWVGTGHNAVFTDYSGQDWMVYHAVDRVDPYFAGAVGFTKRPVLMDALDWVDGWPQVRSGLWASDTPQAAPAAQPGMVTRYSPRAPHYDQPGSPITSLSDEFNGASLSSQWSWVRPPSPSSYGVEAGTFRFDTQDADLYVDSNNASVLTEAAPLGDYMVEAKVQLTVPPEGCCFNYVQAGLVVYGGDDNFVKLSDVAIWGTRQTEFAKELAPVPAGYPRYGNTVVGPPGDVTYLRIVKRTGDNGEELYRAYTSSNGLTWTRGGVWTHTLGAAAKIGLVSMGGSGYTAHFDYIRVSTLG